VSNVSFRFKFRILYGGSIAPRFFLLERSFSRLSSKFLLFEDWRLLLSNTSAADGPVRSREPFFLRSRLPHLGISAFVAYSIKTILHVSRFSVCSALDSVLVIPTRPVDRFPSFCEWCVLLPRLLFLRKPCLCDLYRFLPDLACSLGKESVRPQPDEQLDDSPISPHVDGTGLFSQSFQRLS